MSEQKLAQAALLRSEERFRLVQEASPDGFTLLKIIRNEQGQIEDFEYDYFNPAAAKFLLRPLTDLKGKRLRQEYPTTEQTGVFEQYRKVVETGQSSIEEIYYQGDGINDWFRLTAFKLDDNEIGIYLTNITQRKQVEARNQQLLIEAQIARSEAEVAKAQVEQEKQRLQQLFMEAPAMIAVLRGPNHVFEMANPSYLRSVGRPAHSVVGKPLMEALPELAGQGFDDLLDKVYQTGQAFAGNEIPARLDLQGNGQWEELFFNILYRALPDLDGQVEGIFVHAVDVTELVRARQAAEQITAELQIANGRKDEFLRIASHDLRTPLTSIRGYMQLLERSLKKQLESSPNTPEAENNTSQLTEAEQHQKLTAKNLNTVGHSITSG